MYRASNWPLALLSLVLAVSLLLTQSPARTRNIRLPPEDFPAAIKNIRETWVREFNAGHADRVAARPHNYTVESLHTEYTGNLGYDTGIYDEDFPHHLAEGNYLMVIQKIDGE